MLGVLIAGVITVITLITAGSNKRVNPFSKLDVLLRKILGRSIEALAPQTKQTNCRSGIIANGWQRKCFCAENDTVIN